MKYIQEVKISKNYMAPEIEKNNYNNKCDLWSLGVILYELYTNNYIFYSMIQRKKMKIDMKERLNMRQIMK